MALVDVLRKLSGVDVQEAVNLFVVHGVHLGFLGFGNGGGFVNGLPVAFRGAAGFVVGKAVHLLSPPGGCFINGVICGHGVNSFFLICAGSTRDNITGCFVYPFTLFDEFGGSFLLKIFWRPFCVKKGAGLLTVDSQQFRR